jgi:hypothetical protein
MESLYPLARFGVQNDGFPAMNPARRQKLVREIDSLEAEYREKLIAALTLCARGFWGLFEQNFSPRLEETRRQSGAAELDALAAEIAELRERAGIAGQFVLPAKLAAMRGRQHENRAGEPKLAQAWLAELAAETA